MLRRIWSLVIKEFIHLSNDWWLPAFMLIGGAMELFLVGWATSRPITNLPIMVLDQRPQRGQPGTGSCHREHGHFPPAAIRQQHVDHRRCTHRGTINAAVVIPPDFKEQMASPIGTPTLFVVLNGAESTPALAAKRAIEGLTQVMGQRITIQRLGLSPMILPGSTPVCEFGSTKP